MSHVFEQAPSGRAKCRGCGQAIVRGELRFGERIPNPFGDGEATLWFHPFCAAYKRPESVLQYLEESPGSAPDAEVLERAARGNSTGRLPRIDGAERSPTGQAKCRSCREPIGRGAWRIRLVYFEEGRFLPGGFVHLECRKEYFEREDIEDPVLHFSRNLQDAERLELIHALRAGRDG